VGVLCGAWAAFFAFFVATIEFLNDHFGRISPARQIVRYGELPFRDYFDPGYYLTEFSSAAVQRLLGDNLLGEALLNGAFMATGTVVVLVLARRLSRSTIIGCAAAIAAMLAMPRAYDYDKVLFYPLGLLLCWRYLERRRTLDLVVLGAGIVVAALYRYDSGVYLWLAAAAVIVLFHGPDRTGGLRAVGVLTLSAAACAAPALVFVQLHGGLADAVDQMVTYGIRESEPLQLVAFDPPPPPASRIHVRWTADVDAALRQRLAAAWGLVDEVPQGDPGDRTWAYTLSDSSAERIRTLVSDPRVEDTNGIDRQRFSLPVEPLWTRMRRSVPLLRSHLRGDLFDSRGAAVLFWLLWALPLAAIVLLVRRRHEPDAAQLASLVVLCIVLNLFIMRPPVGARIGGMAGPHAVLAAWLTAEAIRAGWMWRVMAAAVLMFVISALSEVGEWPRRLAGTSFRPRAIERTLTQLAEPGSPAFASPPIGALADYVRRCTAPSDRVFATWFAPDLYFFAQRPFAGRVVAAFSAHWSDARFVERTLASLKSRQVPLVVIQLSTYDVFRASYPTLDAYFQSAYGTAGEMSADGVSGQPVYRILARTTRVSQGTDARTGLPCFGSS
jgi:hypothetical protein